MVTINKSIHEGEEQEWENPLNPEQPTDARDDEQLQRQHEEAKRRRDNLTETDHLDKKNKTN